MRYKTSKNLVRVIKRIMEKGYDRDTASGLANRLFSLVNQHDQSVKSLIQTLEPKEIRD